MVGAQAGVELERVLSRLGGRVYEPMRSPFYQLTASLKLATPVHLPITQKKLDQLVAVLCRIFAVISVINNNNDCKNDFNL